MACLQGLYMTRSSYPDTRRSAPRACTNKRCSSARIVSSCYQGLLQLLYRHTRTKEAYDHERDNRSPGLY
jgi:hypothetical protein